MSKDLAVQRLKEILIQDRKAAKAEAEAEKKTA
jgi:hypothetical protein